MKRAFAFILLLSVSLFLSASIAPRSSRIGRVVLNVEEGSAEELIWNAARSEYTGEWLEKYASSPLFFASAYSSILSSLLPLDDFLLSRPAENEVRLLERKGGRVITFILSDGLISALSVS